MKTLGYYNGTVDELDRITVPMLDRACYFGDGVYDVTYCRNYTVYALDEHIDRFFQSAEMLSIKPTLTKQELRDLICDLVGRLESGDQWVYFQLSRGTAPRSHAFPEAGVTSNLWIMLKPAQIKDTYAPMRCITMEDCRFQYCNIKSLNLLPNVLATEATVEAGADECILHRDGVVTECAHSNISILKDGTLITHPADAHILAGTGRAHLIALCRSMEIPVLERPYTMAELLDADEVIITSASALCVRVSEVDGQHVGGRARGLLRMLQDALYRDFLLKTEKK